MGWVVLIILVLLGINNFAKNGAKKDPLYGKTLYPCPVCDTTGIAIVDDIVRDGEFLEGVLICQNTKCNAIIKNWEGTHFITEMAREQEKRVLDLAENQALRFKKETINQRERIKRIYDTTERKPDDEKTQIEKAKEVIEDAILNEAPGTKTFESAAEFYSEDEEINRLNNNEAPCPSDGFPGYDLAEGRLPTHDYSPDSDEMAEVIKYIKGKP